MNSHTTNLELSKRLFELGVKKDSMFYWCSTDIDWVAMGGYHLYTRDYTSSASGFKAKEFGIPAYLSSELGRVLAGIPKELLHKLPEEIVGTIKNEDTFLDDLYNPDWIAKCIIHLLEQGLIKLEEINK